MQINWIGAMASVNIAITTMNVGYTYAVRTEWIETETTQEGVLKTLDAHKNSIDEIRINNISMQNKIELIPMSIDDSKRWKEPQEMQYQEKQKEKDMEQDRRILLLESAHTYRHNGRYNGRSNDN